MSENSKKYVNFSCINTYYSEKESVTGTTVRIDYSGVTSLDLDYRTNIKNALKAYVNTEIDTNTNILDLISRIREITEDLEERKLMINVNRYGSGEYVDYRKGTASECGAYKEVYDNETSVYISKECVDIRLRRDDVFLKSVDDINYLNQELNELYNIVLSLNNMTKENKENKTLKLTK